MLPTHPHILTARAKPALSPWREVAAGCLAPMRFTRRALPPSQQASSPDRGLDAINLLLAGSGSVYSVFVPVYLTHRGWTQAQIGLALTVNMIAAMVCQVPAGLIMDFLERHRRQTLAVSVIGMGLVAMLLAVAPRWLPTLLAMLLLAAASSFLVPAVNAISLAVAGQAGFSERLGRNSRFGSIGAACGALVMGLCINSGFEAGLLFTAAALTFPSLWAVRAIGPDRVHLSRHGIRNPDEAGPARDGGWHALLRDRRLLVFSVSIALFAVASAGVLQVAAVETNARLGTRSGLVIAAFLILPQIVVAVVSPSIARSAENQGRRPVLLAGFATLPLRGALFALLQSSYALILVQTLEGFGGAVFGVMLSLVAADLTRPTGYYNLCLSILGLAAGLGTTLSAMMVGFTFDRFGGSVALWVLAACGALAFGFVALTMPETSERASPR